VRLLEAKVEQVIKHLAAPAPTWERIKLRIKRTGDSRSTIERDIRRGLLDVKREGRRTYVRDKPGAPSKRGPGRPPGPMAGAAALPEINDPLRPLWPFGQSKKSRLG